jgi:CheY-like chemotaxis protein
MKIAGDTPLLPVSNSTLFSLREISTYRATFPFRVLVVENDPEFRDLLDRNLTSWGFHSVVAQGVGKDLLDNAEMVSALKRCHLALVDMRLINDTDGADTSGLDLVPKLQPTKCIIVSGSARLTRSKEREVRDLPGIVDCVTKGEMSAICKSLKKATEQYWNLAMQYQWPEGYNPEDILKRIRSSNVKNAGIWDQLIDGLSNEVDVALRELYRPDARPIIVALHLRPLERTNVLTSDSLYGRRSVVLFSEPREEGGQYCIREVVKFAPRKHIEAELSNYRDYVNGKLNPAYRASIDGNSKLRDIGALRYTQVEGQRFVEWYSQTNDRNKVHQLIRHLFYSTLRPWWDLNPHHEFEYKNVYEHYTRVFPNLDRWIKSYLERKGNQDLQVYVGAMPFALPDPVSYAFKRQKRPVFKSWWNTPIHGDLHAGNVFIKHDETTCVIDFERSGPGYFFQDFVEFEKTIRLQLLDLSDRQLGYAFYLDALLMSQQRFDTLPDWTPPVGVQDDHPVVQQLRKAFDAICTIRIAAANIGARNDSEHMEEYYWALLMETLFSVTRPGSKDAETLSFAQQRALLAAIVICERLERWKNPRKTWPPEEWNPYLTNPDLLTTGIYITSRSEFSRMRFELTDLRNDKREFRVRVQGIPNQEPQTTSALPYDDNELISIMKLLEFGQYQASDFHGAQIAALQKLGLLVNNDDLAVDWCDRVGHTIFETLVPSGGGVRRAFENTIYSRREGGELQLMVDKESTGLSCYPWEMLHDGYPGDPRTEIDVVRYIASDRTAQDLEVLYPPCRILYVSARPQVLAKVGSDRNVLRDIIASTTSPSHFVVEELKAHTHQALKRRLLDTVKPPIHVLHFDGHGTFARLCPGCQQLNQHHLLVCGVCQKSLADTLPRGYLLFETPSGSLDPVDSIRMLEGIPRSQIKLVVLASCQSARVRGTDLLLAGVGPGLVLGGVPSVVAMQFSITSTDAINFNREFYKALGQGDLLTNAVNRARKMLPEPARWSPVTYLRSRDHQVRLCA